MTSASDREVEIIPTTPPRHYACDENVDEPARLIESEPVDIEAEIPVGRDESVERSAQDDDEANQ